ncbi:hypothetical protein BGZ95_010647 [Linnemannia exigua]|uniref:Uncharacterized protein n=1 Tax=Linnemannia exigua TaxID=604196 RepID=A0AAD4DK60_9FUNG|nr:hypothetical protein BGZ95_010647 [Linnemannia exigua]
MTHNTTNTNPTHNNNVSADKPSTVDAIKEKAAAVVGKLTGKHHTDDHTKDHHHHDTTTGAHTHDTTSAHTHDVTGAHTHGTTGAHTHNPTGAHTHDATGAHTHDATGTYTHDATGTRHLAGANVVAVPSAAPTAVHSTGAGITSGGNVAPPGATQGTTGLASATTQPLNHQNQHHHVHDANTTGVHNNHHHDHHQGTGGMATTAAGAHGINQTHPTAPVGAHLPGTGTGAHHPGATAPLGTGTHGTHATGAATGTHHGTQNVGGVDPNRVEATIDEVTSRLVGAPGDPNNLDPAHIKPTM